MLETLKWLLVVELVGLLAVPVVLRAFPNLSDRGWGFARPVGLILLGTATWLFSYARFIPNSTFGWWLIACLLLALSLTIAFRDRVGIGQFLSTRRRLVLANEIAFIGFFLLVCTLRAFIPSVEATEKPMELMFLNSSVAAQHAPPEDSWLSGHAVSYYYFGYWIFGGLSTMSGVPTEWAFNLALALIAGASASAIFTLVSSMVRRDGGSQTSAIVVAAGSTMMLLFVATLAGWWELAAQLGIGPRPLYEWLHIDGLAPGQGGDGWRPDQHWWWFRASRVINTFSDVGSSQDFTIQEFPSFSFILGDLHPHVISIPFVLTGIGVAANILWSPQRWGVRWLWTNRWPAATAVFVIGASGFVNAWDILFLLALIAGVTTFKVMRDESRRLLNSLLSAMPALFVLSAMAFTLYSPYYIGTLESQVQSPPIGPVRHGTRMVHFLTVWGGMFILAAVFVVVRLRAAITPQIAQSRLSDSTPAAGTAAPWDTWWTGAALIAVPYLGWYVSHLIFNEGAEAADFFTRLATSGPLAALFILLLAAITWRSKRGAADSTQLALILGCLFAYMLYGTELVFVHDRFGNRMNTVFKLYYQAWIALAVAVPFGAYSWWQLHRHLTGRGLIASRTVAIVAGVLMIGPVYYPVAAAVTRATEYEGRPTLDGLAWLVQRAPDEYAAIQWLRDHAEGRPTIAEAVGGSYTEFGRISETTGLPTVLGWTGHEVQWRSDPTVFSDRELDVRVLYETDDPDNAQRIIRKYEIGYVVIGPRERSAYRELQEEKFDTLGDRVFEQGAYVIYRLR